MQSNQYQHPDTDPFPRRVLLAVTGLSPQVVTETLYALAVKAEHSLIPTEVQVITTTDGADRARLTLLSDEPGWFQRLRRDFDLPPIAFDETRIHVLPGANGRSLEDIRTPADNERAADFITERVRELTADPSSRLHASIAGGRKTMGFYLGYALSLYGRDQDCLSHVLVSARYESHPDFYYPTPYPRVIHTPPPDSRPLDTKEAEVTLAEIPFVSLRHGLPEDLLAGHSSFSESVAAVSWALGPPRLVVDRAGQRLLCGERAVAMKPADLAFYSFYSWLAGRKKAGRESVHWTDAGLTEELLDEYGRLVSLASGAYERLETSLRRGITKEYFEQRKSKTNAALRRGLGKTACQPYLIACRPGRPYSRFELDLTSEQITFAASPQGSGKQAIAKGERLRTKEMNEDWTSDE